MSRCLRLEILWTWVSKLNLTSFTLDPAIISARLHESQFVGWTVQLRLVKPLVISLRLS